MRLSILAFSTAALLGFGGPAFAGDQDFTLQNRTGYQIDNVFISRHSASQWGDDVLGKDALPDGSSTPITFPDRQHGCHWDLMVRYHSDSNTVTWSDINLCEVNKITLRYDRKQNATRASFD
jgi:hypothetical protein